MPASRSFPFCTPWSRPSLADGHIVMAHETELGVRAPAAIPIRKYIHRFIHGRGLAPRYGLAVPSTNCMHQSLCPPPSPAPGWRTHTNAEVPTGILLQPLWRTPHPWGATTQS